jgi:uncharacterized protein YjbI with pentapeptide repeats
MGAELKGANLRKTDLRGADLRGADLSGYTDLRDSIISESTQLDEKWLLVWEILNRPVVSRDLMGVDLSHANLSKADLSGANLSKANLSQTNLTEADLRWANLSQANLTSAYLSEANLFKANLSLAFLNEADIRWANLSEAKLRRTKFFRANLSRANLSRANLSRADLSEAKLFKASLVDAELRRATLIRTDFEQADLVGSQVYGISAWDLVLAGANQKDLRLTLPGAATIMVDDLEVAQFIYLMLSNKKIKNLLDIFGQKGVLILGRFGGERAAILDALRTELRRRDFLPLSFEYENPDNGKVTDTVSLLARMSRFIIADLTNARDLPQELQAIVPRMPALPVHPIILESQYDLSVVKNLLNYHWVLMPYRYLNREQLIASLAKNVIMPVEIKAEQIARRRRRIEDMMAMID